MGHAPGQIHLVEACEDVAKLEIRNPDRLACVTQTTLSVDDTRELVEALQARYPQIVGPKAEDICYATSNRQAAVKELCRLVELVLVIGAPNSSNCNRLREVAEAHGVTAYLINGPDEIDVAWLEGIDKVGITSGASTPESLVQDVITAVRPEEVVPIDGVEEDVSFVLPRELR